MISGTTRVAAVIGDPIRHSRSPAIHNAAYAATGLDWVLVALEVHGGRGYEAVRAAPALGLAGLSVTMPHKADAARACHTLAPDAATLGAVNTVVVHPDGTLRGASTDGEGWLRAVGEGGLDVAGRHVLVLGAGGAARAVVLALGRRGARVTVAARDPEAAAAAAALADGRAVPLGLADPAGVDVVVNATPLGMHGEEVPVRTPARGQWAVDLVYEPAETPFLRAAAAAGARTVGGLGMLVHQAALAFELMTGRPAPLDVMRDAATR